jgi:lipopolysaccharide export system permease protein
MRLIDRYLLVELSKRLAVVLAVVLGSLVLERLLRLFDAVSMKGGPFYMVWEMALMLVPHYLGLALPAGFFVSIYLVSASCNVNNEFDVLLSGGVSPFRFAAPFVAAAVALTAISIALFGYVQPHSRYAYRSVSYLVDVVPWDIKIPERIFASVDKHTTVSADRVSADGHDMSGLFVRLEDNGRETVITAESGRLSFGPQRASYRLDMRQGMQFVSDGKGDFATVAFDRLLVDRPLVTAVPPFRERGGDSRELSLGELATEAHDAAAASVRAEADGEFHARLVRAVSMLFLPFLTIPLALTAKRRQRSAGIVFGSLVLVTYHYTLQTLEGLSEAGRVPVAGMWAVMAVFAVLSFVLFWRAQRHPGENFLDPILAVLADAIGWIVRRFARPESRRA